MKKFVFTYIFSFLVIVLLILFSFLYTPRFEWIMVMIFSAIIYGITSPLIAARRLYFLVSEVSHIALFSVTLSIALARETMLQSESLWAIIIGLTIVYAIGYAMYKGINPDIATSIAISATASGSVVAMFFVLTRYRVGYNLWSVVIGDPLLTTWNDIMILSVLTTVILPLALIVYRVAIYMGIDRDVVMLSVKRIALYEFLFFTVLGVACIVLIRITGYILEHVLLLLPALIAINLVEGSSKIMILSIYISLISSLLGFMSSLWLNIAPASAIGFIVLSAYIFSVIVKKVKKYG